MHRIRKKSQEDQRASGKAALSTVASTTRVRLLWVMAWVILVSLSHAAAAGSGSEWLYKEKFRGIRVGVEEETLLRARELGINVVLANDNGLLDPEDPGYPTSLQRLKRVSALAKELGLHFFVGWHALGLEVRKLAAPVDDEKEGLRVSHPLLWQTGFAGPMERVAEALSGPEYRLDGFLPDVENYARKKVQWDGGWRSLGSGAILEVAERARATREKIQSIKPGLLLGIYPIREKDNRKVLWAWTRGMSQPDQPLLLLVEYTYEGYRPELELSHRTDTYRKKAGNPVILIPGFNFLKISEPSAWPMHLYAFAKETGGYWLYPGSHLIRKGSAGTRDTTEAYAAVRRANHEIHAFLKEPSRTSVLDYRKQPPHETEKLRLDDLLQLAGEVSSPVKGKSGVGGKGACSASLRTGNADFLIKAGPAEPIRLSVRGRGSFSVYDGAGQLLDLREFAGDLDFHLPVASAGVYPVVLNATGGSAGVEVKVENRSWSFRGVPIGTSSGKTSRLLNRPGPGPFSFYVPEGTRSFRMFLSDKRRESYAVIRDDVGHEVVRQSAGFGAGQDVEIPVPEERAGRIWSVEGNPLLGLPRMVIYGIPDLFNPDPERLLTLDEKTLRKQKADLDRGRTRKRSGSTFLWVEAEELYGGPWRLSQAYPGASGKGAMIARDSSTLSLYGEVLVPHPGEWRVWVRALTGDRESGKRAVRVQVGDRLLAWTHNQAEDSPGYKWQGAGAVRLTSGRKMLRLHQAKGGKPMIDAVVLSDDPRWHPVGIERP